MHLRPRPEKGEKRNEKWLKTANLLANYAKAYFFDEQSLPPQCPLSGGKEEGELELLTNKTVPGETTIYVCPDKACQLPVNDPELALKQLR